MTTSIFSFVDGAFDTNANGFELFIWMVVDFFSCEAVSVFSCAVVAFNVNGAVDYTLNVLH